MDAADDAPPDGVVAPVPVVQDLQRVIRERGAALGAALQRMGEYVLPPRAIRVLLVVLPLLAATTEIWAVLTGDRPHVWLLIAASVVTNGSVVAMAWRPPVGAIAILLAGVLAAAVGEQGEYLTVLTMSAGVVFFTCTGAFAFVHAVAAVVWIVVIATTPPGLDTAGLSALFVIGLLSATVGRALRRVVLRNWALHSDLEAHEAHLDEALKAERDRIADELHDVIAHDISIAVMHARVLERTDDPDTRASSQRAIVTASAQALTDTRRVLQLIHGRPESIAGADAETRDFRAEVEALAQKLRELGDDVEVSVRGDAHTAGIIGLTLSRAAREAVTNVVKHSVAPRRVRISVALSRETAVLEVVNEPHVPAAASPPGTAFGLARIRERVEVLGGRFAAGPHAGAWRVRVSLPTR